VLTSLGELMALVLDFVEQANVLDRDHCLIGEGGGELDLLVGEGPYRSTQESAITPIGLASRRSGTARVVRKPAIF
jgi:hypothetical protein